MSADINSILRTEFSDDFIDGMKNRMVVSYHKYGAVADAYPDKVNAVESLKVRLDRYAATGNTEWLIDAANFAMIEFMHPGHPHAHFQGTDDDASPGRVSARTGRSDKQNNTLIGTNERSRTARFRQE